jgi:3-oxoacyl-[acyl-carrier-protein] synthase II
MERYEFSSDRRGFPRIVGTFPVEIKFRDVTSHKLLSCKGKTVNISEDGMLVKVDSSILLPPFVNIRVGLPPSYSPKQIRARVVWSKPFLEEGKFYWGFRFLKLPYNLKALLCKYLDNTLKINRNSSERRRIDRRANIKEVMKQISNAEATLEKIERVMQDRAVITGIGAVTPYGVGKEVFWDALIDKKIGIRRLGKLYGSHSVSKIAGEVKKFDPTHYGIPQDIVKQTSRATQFALIAAKLALEDAKINTENEIREKMGIILGTASFPSETSEKVHREFLCKGIKGILSTDLLALLPSSSTGWVATLLGLKGKSETVLGGCTGGIQALGNAYHVVRRGENNIVLAGATDTPLSPFALGLMYKASLLARSGNPSSAARPFDSNRNGEVPAEGCTVVVLESWKHAQRRKPPKIYCEICGYSNTTDGWDVGDSDPSGVGLARAILQALEMAKISPKDVELVVAHASGFPKNDAAEIQALKRIFIRNKKLPPVISVKGLTGQPLSVGGLFQLLAAIFAMDSGIIPGTYNCDQPDSEDPFDHIIKGNRKVAVENAVINSYGYGGCNAVIVIKKRIG